MKKKEIWRWLVITGSFAVLAGCHAIMRPLAAETGGEIWEQEYQVSDRAECRRLLKELVSSVREPGRYEVTVTGEDFEPDSLVIAQVFPGVINISNTKLKTETADGHMYTTCRIGFERKREKESCEHVWESEYTEPPGCILSGKERLTCYLCGSVRESVVAAAGHLDEAGDTVCDRCGSRVREQEAGDTISVCYEDGAGERILEFICVGSASGGGQIYRSLEPFLTEEIFRETEQIAGSREEKLFWWLRNEFRNAISVRAACSGELFFSESGEIVTEGKWTESESVYPGFILQPAEEETSVKESWAEGDERLVLIGGEYYRFRCIDDDYRARGSYDQRNALFLCETVIRSDVDSTDTQRKVLLFGENNNYKISEIREWLQENGGTDEEMAEVETGVNFAFQGRTEEGAFGELTERGLTSCALPEQYITDRLFLLSVEEALAYREELFAVAGGESAFDRGYWLRTPVYEESEDGVFQYGTREYAVDLKTGCIRPAEVTSGEFGIRPAFCLPQA